VVFLFDMREWLLARRLQARDQTMMVKRLKRRPKKEEKTLKHVLLRRSEVARESEQWKVKIKKQSRVMRNCWRNKRDANNYQSGCGQLVKTRERIIWRKLLKIRATVPERWYL
jgi:hypothetical protein